MIQTETYSKERKNLTGILTPVGMRCCIIPEEDAKRLAQIYERAPHEGLKLSPENFILELSYRFYTEWCMNTPGNSHKDYAGEGFVIFAKNETHYELERRGFSWNKDEKIFRDSLGHALSNKDYEYVKERVLEAIVKRAVLLLRDWKGIYSPEDKNDKRNLRNNLKEYMD